MTNPASPTCTWKKCSGRTVSVAGGTEAGISGEPCHVSLIGSRLPGAGQPVCQGVRVGDWPEHGRSAPATFPQFVMSELDPEEGEKSSVEVFFKSTESLFATSSLHDPSSCFAELLLVCCRRKLSVDELSVPGSCRVLSLLQPEKNASGTVALEATTLQKKSQRPQGSFFSLGC